MAERSPFSVPLAEADLRDVKADAVGRLAEGARRVGGEPNLANIERFVAPIVEKINRDHDGLLDKGIDPQAPKRTPSAPPRANRDGVETERSGSLGHYDFAKGEFVPTVAGQAVLARRNAPLSLNMRAVQFVIRRIVKEPELAVPWKALLQTAMFRELPPGHTGMACAACGLTKVCVVRETAIRAIVARFIEKFGDPRPQLLREDMKGARRG